MAASVATPRTTSSSNYSSLLEGNDEGESGFRVPCRAVRACSGAARVLEENKGLKEELLAAKGGGRRRL